MPTTACRGSTASASSCRRVSRRWRVVVCLFFLTCRAAALQGLATRLSRHAVRRLERRQSALSRLLQRHGDDLFPRCVAWSRPTDRLSHLARSPKIKTRTIPPTLRTLPFETVSGVADASARTGAQTRSRAPPPTAASRLFRKRHPRGARDCREAALSVAAGAARRRVELHAAEPRAAHAVASVARRHERHDVCGRLRAHTPSGARHDEARRRRLRAAVARDGAVFDCRRDGRLCVVRCVALFATARTLSVPLASTAFGSACLCTTFEVRLRAVALRCRCPSALQTRAHSFVAKTTIVARARRTASNGEGEGEGRGRGREEEEKEVDDKKKKEVDDKKKKSTTKKKKSSPTDGFKLLQRLAVLRQFQNGSASRASARAPVVIARRAPFQLAPLPRDCAICLSPLHRPVGAAPRRAFVCSSRRALIDCRRQAPIAATRSVTTASSSSSSRCRCRCASRVRSVGAS